MAEKRRALYRSSPPA